MILSKQFAELLKEIQAVKYRTACRQHSLHFRQPVSEDEKFIRNLCGFGCRRAKRVMA